MRKIVWSPEKGWHDDGQEARIVLEKGRIKIVPGCEYPDCNRPAVRTVEYEDEDTMLPTALCGDCLEREGWNHEERGRA